MLPVAENPLSPFPDFFRYDHKPFFVFFFSFEKGSFLDSTPPYFYGNFLPWVISNCAFYDYFLVFLTWVLMISEFWVLGGFCFRCF